MPAAFLGHLAIFSGGSVLAAACAGAVFLVTLILLFLVLLDRRHFVCIHPYFEKPVASGERPVASGAAFRGGEALARNLEPLDALADEVGIAPLSAFGFEDDFFGEQLTWHAPEEGLKTVLALLDSLKEQPGRVCDLKGVTNDLKKIASALEDARKRSIRFCFLVRVSSATNSMEWEHRKGTAF